MTFYQGEHMMNRTYWDMFYGLVECYEHHVGQSGVQTSHIQEQLDKIAADLATPLT